jgi:hypothetical protein
MERSVEHSTQRSQPSTELVASAVLPAAFERFACCDAVADRSSRARSLRPGISVKAHLSSNVEVHRLWTYDGASVMSRYLGRQPGNHHEHFHWAGVVLKDEADNVTLENFAVTAETAKDAGTTQGKYIDREWNFDMYGTVNAKGEVDEDQTFHKEHLDSGTHGTRATSMTVRTDK